MAITDITSTGAKSGGDITYTGDADITGKGICWSTSQKPTILDFVTAQGGNTSNYASNINDLTANTTYYVRAYATNSKGTGYGNELSFIAQNIFPGEKINVAGGTFTMGSPDGIGDANERPEHSVTLSDFSISKYEITNAQYATYMNAISAPSDGIVDGTEYLDMSKSVRITYTAGQFVATFGNENHPVGHVSWFGAKGYSEYYGGRLPTEAEWEFAARGGINSNDYTYSGSNTLDDVAWYSNNSENKPHNVGTKFANELGLHDMSGNVAEWCNDWSDSYNNGPISNPQGPSTGIHRVIRGGSRITSNDKYFRVACRVANNPWSTISFLGFRPVFTP